MNSKQVRTAFLEFFRSKQHEVVPSAPMVVKNDPTLMFTNAGMNQFKDIFLNISAPKYSRVANSQKCLRVSGKHNDLEEVGHDTYHHTMFEMLGNWSFGNYFKKEAINWAWEFLVEELKLPKERLYATVFEGNAEEGIDPDSEALALWKQYLPENRIIWGNKKDNFWEMGDSGPCGPCSELHIDLRSDELRALIPGETLVNTSDPLVIEVWNLVFIQFNRKANGALEPLPAKHVDTGMGFERLCMAVQGKQSNYDTDVFQPIIQKIASLSGKVYGSDAKADIAMRVIADHLRAISFAIADGQLPSNVKAGYVIRRILRRAVRYGFTFLGFTEPSLYKLVQTLVDQMGDAYPDLKKQQQLVEKVIAEEESSFLRTLDTGIRLLDQHIEVARKDGKLEISGSSAFELYDTFGFPLDLTELILREKGMSVDRDGFNKAMEVQKERSRAAAVTETDDWVEVKPLTTVEFVGYDNIESEVNICRYRTVKAKNKTLYQLVFDRTPFYAESGGQVGDSGYIEADGERIVIIDTQKENNLIVHITETLPKNPSVSFHAAINTHQRQLTANNHSATHLLHEALRETLGTHVEQKGSLVNPENIRFDFAHFQKLSEEDIAKIEAIVNRKIRENHALVERRNTPIAEAQKLGAMALFGEKYGDSVRVIQFGTSVELCGGTHVSASGKIGFFKITSEGAISAGVRRIEAITADRAEQFINESLNEIKEAKTLLNNNGPIAHGIQKMLEENKRLTKELEGLMKEKLSIIKEALKAKAKVLNGVTLIAETFDLSPDSIKDLAYQLKGEIVNLAFVAGSIAGGKPSLTIMLSDSVMKEKGLNASTIVREAAKEIQGGGGGQPFFASAGGKNIDGIQAAIAKATSLITQ
ncbi:alanine--tRNA ligase [Williamwhitmania taraxaci]|uniref:Alanine--tRNA ligase n=1 Tax=Williamwhitmania taraxaci TaxID=1640674 RepID=A0A1G6GRR7_9BACT|nr:alanine--tRNA ligase [Williamwhitmania taraxaci]SDB84732.1 alanyl-tRNA synthetase [Williamwhitmania taraxaci]